jgi:beta-glucosidase
LKTWDKFEGFVMSDWGGTHSTSMAATNGLDMEMPGGGFYTADKFDAALAGGRLKQATIDDMATRVLTTMYAVGIFDTPQPTGSSAVNATSVAHAALAQHLAEQAAVLLRNEKVAGNAAPLLPLQLKGSNKYTVAVIGAAANCTAPTPTTPNWGWPPSAGCLNSGGGSGSVDASYVMPVLAAIQLRHASAGSDGGDSRDNRESGDSGDSRESGDTSERGESRDVSDGVSYDDGMDSARAAKVAAAADVAVVVVGISSGESADRNGTSLPTAQLAYLRAVAAAQPNTVVVLTAPGSVTMDWADAVPSVVCFFMPGQGYGAAVARVIYGDVNPSGKTPVTMPRTENEMGLTPSQYPGLDGTGHTVPSSCGPKDGIPHAVYSEKLNVGYRWYNSHPDVKPAFAFGTGLSYTSFGYSALAHSTVRAADSDGASDAANHTISFNVTNTGDVAGAEVAMLFLTFPASAGEPPLQLKGFEKVPLQPKESKRVSFVLGGRDLSIFDTTMRGWAEQRGDFSASVGGGLSALVQHTSFTN